MNSDKEEKREKREIEEKKAVEGLFSDYRRSGLALMATVIGLSSGGFFGLFQITETRDVSFLYLIPITISLLQQLTYYFGSRERALSENDGFACRHYHFDSDSEYMSASIASDIKRIHSKFYYGLSDAFCWLAVLALMLVTICPMAMFSSSLVGVVFCLALSACLGYWAWKRYEMKRQIDAIEW